MGIWINTGPGRCTDVCTGTCTPVFPLVAIRMGGVNKTIKWPWPSETYTPLFNRRTLNRRQTIITVIKWIPVQSYVLLPHCTLYALMRSVQWRRAIDVKESHTYIVRQKETEKSFNECGINKNRIRIRFKLVVFAVTALYTRCKLKIIILFPPHTM